jgi:hypothetical protein
MRIKVYMTLQIDEDEYPVPTDGRVDEEISETFSDFIYDIDGISIETIRIVSE